jgi:hypothetical protein
MDRPKVPPLLDLASRPKDNPYQKAFSQFMSSGSLIPYFLEKLEDPSYVPDLNNVDRATRADAAIAFLIHMKLRDGQTIERLISLAEKHITVGEAFSDDLSNHKKRSEKEILEIKDELKKAHGLLNDKQSLTIHKAIFNTSNVSEAPSQNSKEEKRWYSKVWGMLNSPFCLGMQSLFNTIAVFILWYCIAGQHASLEYLKKNLNIPTQPVSKPSQTFRDSTYSSPHGNYTGSKTHLHNPVNSQPKRDDKSPKSRASE